MSKQLLFHAVFGLMLLFLPLSHKIYLLLKIKAFEDSAWHK